jgi:hypothetical protein
LDFLKKDQVGNFGLKNFLFRKEKNIAEKEPKTIMTLTANCDDSSMKSAVKWNLSIALATECVYLGLVYSLDNVGGFEKVALVLLSAFVAGFLAHGIMFSSLMIGMKLVLTGALKMIEADLENGTLEIVSTNEETKNLKVLLEKAKIDAMMKFYLM